MALRSPLRWVGGKTQLLPELLKRVPPKIETYYEPMAGGLALFFELVRLDAIKHARISDTNGALVNFYQQMQCSPEEVISHLREQFPLPTRCKKEDFTIERSKFNEERTAWTPEDAARFYYLNRICFNGLYRVNSKGELNTTFGAIKAPKYDFDNLREVTKALQIAEITQRSYEYLSSHVMISSADFVYLDPPYDPLTPTSAFTGFTRAGFQKEDHVKMAQLMKYLEEDKIKMLVSNSDTPFIHATYAPFCREVVFARRNVNADGTKRGKIPELLIRNYVL